MTLEAKKLISAFLAKAKEAEEALAAHCARQIQDFLILGRIRWDLEQALNGSAFKVLVEAGASKGTVSNAKYGAAAWGAVQSGEITESEFAKLTFDDCRMFAGIPGQLHPASKVLNLRRTYDISAEAAVFLAKAPVKTKDLEAVVVEAKKFGYLGEGRDGSDLIRAIEMKTVTGAKVLPKREELADARACDSGISCNITAASFRLARDLSDIALDEMEREALASLHRALLPVKAAIMRIEARLREIEGKGGNDRRGRSRRAAN